MKTVKDVINWLYLKKHECDLVVPQDVIDMLYETLPAEERPGIVLKKGDQIVDDEDKWVVMFTGAWDGHMLYVTLESETCTNQFQHPIRKSGWLDSSGMFHQRYPAS